MRVWPEWWARWAVMFMIGLSLMVAIINIRSEVQEKKRDLIEMGDKRKYLGKMRERVPRGGK